MKKSLRYICLGILSLVISNIQSASAAPAWQELQPFPQNPAIGECVEAALRDGADSLEAAIVSCRHMCASPLPPGEPIAQNDEDQVWFTATRNEEALASNEGFLSQAQEWNDPFPGLLPPFPAPEPPNPGISVTTGGSTLTCNLVWLKPNFVELTVSCVCDPSTQRAA